MFSSILKGSTIKDKHKISSAFISNLLDLTKVASELNSGDSSSFNRWTFLKHIVTTLEITKDDTKKTNDYIRVLMKATEFVDFFKQIKDKKRYVNNHIHEKLCRKMKLEKAPGFKVLYKEGSQSDKFYVILQGIVILVKHNIEYNIRMHKSALKFIVETITEKSLDPVSLKQFLDKHMEESTDLAKAGVHFHEIKNGMVIYKDSYIKQYWSNVNPLNITEFPIFDDKTGVMMYHKSYLLKAGSKFGDLAAEDNNARYYTAVAIMDTVLVYLEKEDYKDILLPQERKKKEEVKSFFSEKVFKNAEFSPARDKLIELFHEVKFKQGMHLFKQGDKMKSLFVLKKGEVKLYSVYHKESKPNEDSNGAMKKFNFDRKIDVAIQSTGEFIGDHELFHQKSEIDFSALCITDCKLYEIRLDYLKHFVMIYYPDFEKHIQRISEPKLESRARYFKDFINSVDQINNKGKNNGLSTKINGFVSDKIKVAKDLYRNFLGKKKLLEAKTGVSRWAIEDGEKFISEIENFGTIEYVAQVKEYQPSDKINSGKQKNLNALDNFNTQTMQKMFYVNESKENKKIEVFRCYDLETLLKGPRVPKLNRPDVFCNGENFMSEFDQEVANKYRKKAYMQDINSIVIFANSKSYKFKRKVEKEELNEFDIKKQSKFHTDIINKNLSIQEEQNKNHSLNLLISNKHFRQMSTDDFGYKEKSQKPRKMSTRQQLFDILRKDQDNLMKQSNRTEGPCKCLDNILQTSKVKIIKSTRKSKHESSKNEQESSHNRSFSKSIGMILETSENNDILKTRPNLNTKNTEESVQKEIKSLAQLYNEAHGCEISVSKAQETKKKEYDFQNAKSNNIIQSINNPKIEELDIEKNIFDNIETEIFHKSPCSKSPTRERINIVQMSDLHTPLLANFLLKKHGFDNNESFQNSNIKDQNFSEKPLDPITKFMRSKTEIFAPKKDNESTENFKDFIGKKISDTQNTFLSKSNKQDFMKINLQDLMTKDGKNAIQRAYIPQNEFQKAQVLTEKKYDLEALYEIREMDRETIQYIRETRSKKFQETKQQWGSADFNKQSITKNKKNTTINPELTYSINPNYFFGKNRNSATAKSTEKKVNAIKRYFVTKSSKHFRTYSNDAKADPILANSSLVHTRAGNSHDKNYLKNEFTNKESGVTFKTMRIKSANINILNDSAKNLLQSSDPQQNTIVLEEIGNTKLIINNKSINTETTKHSRTKFNLTNDSNPNFKRKKINKQNFLTGTNKKIGIIVSPKQIANYKSPINMFSTENDDQTEYCTRINDFNLQSPTSNNLQSPGSNSFNQRNIYSHTASQTSSQKMIVKNPNVKKHNLLPYKKKSAHISENFVVSLNQKDSSLSNKDNFVSDDEIINRNFSKSRDNLQERTTNAETNDNKFYYSLKKNPMTKASKGRIVFGSMASKQCEETRYHRRVNSAMADNLHVKDDGQLSFMQKEKFGE